MGFRINTNIAALAAHNNATMNNRMLDKSLGALSSGLRINSAADDASGMAIADSLRSQASSLGQAVRNANDAIGIIQTADKAMDEQIKILDTIKTKAIQAASDNQTGASREAIQSDVNRLIESLDAIATTTSFNGNLLLNGTYANKEFQIGAFSNQTVAASIGNTQSIATGNISTREDISQLGNTATLVTAGNIGKGSLDITISAGAGLAVGDTIRIDGLGNYQIMAVLTGTANATTAGMVVRLDRGLEAALTGATNISLVSTATENLSTVSTGGILSSGNLTLAVTDITGLSVGDAISFVNSAGQTMTRIISAISGTTTAGAGNIVLVSGGIGTGVSGSGAILSAATFNYSIQMESRASVGTSYSAADYVQYTIEGADLTAVQITDADGNGVAGGGLGAVADQINATTSETGIKAVADVSVDSQIAVQGMTLTSDIVINGETILSAGDTIAVGDSDNKLIDAINAATSKTGVSAALEADGSLTLTSDGRAMNLSGLSGVAGINDGVVSGTLQITSNVVGDIDLSAVHYTDATLTQVNAAASDLQAIESSSNLADLVNGRVDDNGDGLVNSDDTVGLLRTKKGAMLAMDITEASITKLDASRADLGSVQNALVVTINNISVTQVNVKAAESQIRDVDFASESANFSRLNILAQSGSYAMSQANAVQQNVLRLLQ